MAKARLRVLLVSNYLPDRQHSMLGFAGALERELPACGCEVTRIAPKQSFGAGFKSGSLGKYGGYVDKFMVFPRDLRRKARNADVVHILDQGNSLYTAHLGGHAHLVTCHDLLAVRAARGEFEGWSVGRLGAVFQSLVLRSLDRSKFIACASTATWRDLLRILPNADTRSKVLYDSLFRTPVSVSGKEADETLEGLGVSPPYLLHIGGNDHYKNRIGLIRIFKHLQATGSRSGLRLVLAGAPLSDELRSVATDQVLQVANPTDREIDCLYAGAEALCFPSLWEGFGLPVLEAQSQGCPVFCSLRAPLTEVGGSAARYFDPADEEKAAARISLCWPERAIMRSAGLENVKRFNARDMAASYHELYLSLGRSR